MGMRLRTKAAPPTCCGSTVCREARAAHWSLKLRSRCIQQAQLCRAQPGSCVRAQAATSATNESTELQQLKQKLASQAGSKSGLDMSEDAKAPVVQTLKQIAEHPSEREELELTGTTWRALFTNSTSTSAGKFGPFLGTTEQVFPRDQPGSFINSVELFGGSLRLELYGSCAVGSNHKLDLVFHYVKAFFAKFPITKRDFPENYNAFWRVMYADKDLRVFETNQGNYFAMYNVDGKGTVYDSWSRFDKSKFT